MFSRNRSRPSRIAVLTMGFNPQPLSLLRLHTHPKSQPAVSLRRRQRMPSKCGDPAAGRPERPPLLSQGSGPAAMAGSYVFRPAPFINTSPPSTGASALGPGTPSDWEDIFGPNPGDFDDAAWFPPRQSSAAPGHNPTTFGHPTWDAQHIRGKRALAVRPSEDRIQVRQFQASALVSIGDRTHRQDSPISPCTTHGVQTPPPPTRVDSDSSAVSAGGHSESIDNVIDAWARPLSPPSKPAQPGLHGPISQPQSFTQFNQTIPAKEPESTQSILPLLSI